MARKILIASAIIIAIPVAIVAAHFAPVVTEGKSEVAFTDFTQARFDTARAAGKRILVEVHAPWCPVCARQQAAITTAQRLAANAGVVLLRIDYDSQKDVQRPLGVTSQSTLIAFKGKTETGRLLGDTDPKAIAGLFASTL